MKMIKYTFAPTFTCASKLLLLSLLLSLGVSCTRKRPQASELPAFSINAQAVFKDGFKTISGTANIRWHKDSLVWASMSKFGFEGLRLRIISQEVGWLDRLNKSYHRLAYDSVLSEFPFGTFLSLSRALLLGEVPNMPYIKESDMLLGMNLGTVQLKTTLRNAKQVAKHLLTLPKYDAQVHYTYDQERLTQVRFEASTKSKETQYSLDLTYTSVKWLEDVSVPFQVPDSYERL